ncbi:hypothetical protein DL98DRAFT_594543 [Cadophora sp. DSE1049]|nr:hypothetical protein DL98DRAFT_594543 [Cadophora sp. DSE1049]
MATPGACNIHPCLHKLLDDIETFFSEPFEGDRISKENSSGTEYYDVFDNWSSWSRGCGFKGGNNYNDRAGPLNNGSRYSSPYDAQNGAQLLWGQKSDVSNNQGSDVTQQKYILPITNPNALKYGAISMAPSTAEKNIFQFPVLPPSPFRNLYSRPPYTPTWVQNNMQAQIDSIVAASMTSSARHERRYCRQSIHPSVCASIRVSCKYLHVMPIDADPQVELVLYYGMPRWYRDHIRNELAKNGIWPSNRQDSS